MSPSTVMRPMGQLLLKQARAQHIQLPFLAPSLVKSSAAFSTSSPASYPRDMNRERGVSTVRRTGPRQPLSVSNDPLPVPVTDASKRTQITVDENHGLYDFFHSKDKPMNTPEENNAHGRPWTPSELRNKSWEDLHALWWQCCKERNRIATEDFERNRLNAGYGEHEAKARDTAVRRTQRAIKQVLTERYYSWEDARKIAVNDPEVDLSGEGPAYTPSEDVFEDEMIAEEAHIEQVEAQVKDVQPKA